MAYQVIKATTKDIDGVSVAGKDIKFGKKAGAALVHDAGLAKEIESTYGPKATGDVVVVKQHDNDPGHKYFFTVPEMPWKRSKKDEILRSPADGGG